MYDLKIDLLMIRESAHGWTKMSKKNLLKNHEIRKKIISKSKMKIHI
jgi:hypothetical protein